jgi:DNA transposition AAA+ family ATPase
VCFYGPSGYGKSTAATVAMIQTDAVYVQARSSWTRKAAHQAILKGLGVIPAKTVAEMSDQIAEELSLSKRPLIVDEADYLVERGTIEIIRDLYEASQTPVMLIGEEGLPGKLKRWERFHGRVLDWAPAQPASLKDCKALAELHAAKVRIADDLLDKVHSVAGGSVRRICVNISRIEEQAQVEGRDVMDLAAWGSRELYTGEAPSRRRIA